MQKERGAVMKKTSFFLTTLILLGQLIYAQNDNPVLENPEIFESKNVTLVGRWSNGCCRACFVLNNYAYVAGSDSSLRIIDVSDPTLPNEVGFLDWEYRTYNVYVSENFAYVIVGGGLRIINVSDPTSPIEVAIFNNTIGYALGISVVGNYAYVSTGAMGGPCGLHIIDVSDPSAPNEISFCDNSGGESVYVSGNYAFVVSIPRYGISAFGIIDISDPNSPLDIGNYSAIGAGRGANDVYVSGICAYIADSEHGLSIIDVNDPSSPNEISFYNTEGSARGVYVSDGYAYVADDSEGLRVIDVINPGAPKEVGFFDTEGKACDVYVSESLIYVADSDSGLYILQNELQTIVHDNLSSKPTRQNLSQNHPNPFNSSTTINYSLANDCHVKIIIYNLLGEVVAKLVNGFQSRGLHNVKWDAKNLPGGIYIYRIEADGFSAVKKMFLQK